MTFKKSSGGFKSKNTKTTKVKKVKKPRPSLKTRFSYKEPDTLVRFLTPEGKIVSQRISRLNAKQQRILTREVKRARNLALLPFTHRVVNF